MCPRSEAQVASATITTAVGAIEDRIDAQRQTPSPSPDVLLGLGQAIEAVRSVEHTILTAAGAAPADDPALADAARRPA